MARLPLGQTTPRNAGIEALHNGGNAVDAGIAAMFAAATTEYSHFGWGGEAPILIRTKDGKVHAIAGVGTMPKLATAEFFRTRKIQPGELYLASREGRSAGHGSRRGIDAGSGPEHGGRRSGGSARFRHQII